MMPVGAMKGGEDLVDRADMPADGENGEPPATSSTTNERAASATDGKAEAGEPSLLDRGRTCARLSSSAMTSSASWKALSCRTSSMFYLYISVAAWEVRSIALHGLQCSDKLTKILRTIVRSRSPAEQNQDFVPR